MRPITALGRLVAGLLLSIVALSVPAAATPCRFDPPTLASPAAPPVNGVFPALPPVMVKTVIGATDQQPFRIDVRASQPLTLGWQRFPVTTAIDLRQRLVVSRSTDNGTSYQPYCETDWVPLAQLTTLAVLRLDAGGPARWRIEVFEQNGTPQLVPIEEERAQLLITGALDDQPPPLFSAGMPSVAAAGANIPDPGLCRSSATLAVTDPLPVASAALPPGALKIAGTVYATSGRTLYVRIERQASGTPVIVRFRAKTVGFGTPPSDVCTVAVPNAAPADQWITVTVPWQVVTQLRWFVTFEGDAQSPPLRYIVLRDRRPHAFPTPQPEHLTDVYSCTRPTIEKAKAPDPRKKSNFQFAYALTINTNLRTTGIDAAAYRRIVDGLLTSINNWRAICTSCTPYQFSVVDIDGTVYVPQDMLQGTPGDYRATFIRAYPYVWRTGVGLKATGALTDVAPFVAAITSEQQRLRFCRQAPEPDEMFSAADSPLCRPSPANSDSEMMVNVEWRTAGLGCLDDVSVVACWNGSDEIELNLKDYSFYVGDTGDTLLGTAADGADLIRVFTHEVGHWLGLGHLVGDGNIMADILSSARCIDDRDVAAVNAIARGDTDRQRTSEALHYE